MIYIAFLTMTLAFVLMAAAYNRLWGIVQVMGCQLDIHRRRIVCLDGELAELRAALAGHELADKVREDSGA